MPEERVIASGLAEKIGLNNSEIHYKSDNYDADLQIKISDHSTGLNKIVELLLDPENGVIENVNEIDLVGHRVVHGGNDFIKTTFIDENVKNKIRSLFSLAPLHNPANLTGIEVAEEVFSQIPQIAVFDTSFHQSLPEKAFTYAIPKEIREMGIRVYGFHGISHQYVSQKAVELLNRPNSKLIVIHLGNGCSMTAVHDGKSVEHTLGFSPNEGLIMGTRSGDMDQGVIFYLMEKLGLSGKEVSDILTKKSGMLGLTGHSDLRMIEEEAQNGNSEAQFALELNAYRIKKYIGAFTAAMNGLDAIVFTAGIGENSEVLRKLVCTDMGFFGIHIDDQKNRERKKTVRDISSAESKVNILVIPTNEELEIAKECLRLMNGPH